MEDQENRGKQEWLGLVMRRQEKYDEKHVEVDIWRKSEYTSHMETCTGLFVTVNNGIGRRTTC